MIGKSLFLLVYIVWVFVAAEAISDYKKVKAFSSFFILYLLSWKVFGGIDKSFWLILFGVLIYVTWYIFRHEYSWIEIIISFCVTWQVGSYAFELGWKVFGSDKSFWLILFGVLINVTWYIFRYEYSWIKNIISFCVTCLVGWHVFELVIKPLGSEWLSAYNIIGLIVIIIAILFTLILLIGIHQRIKNKKKVDKVIGKWGDL